MIVVTADGPVELLAYGVILGAIALEWVRTAASLSIALGSLPFWLAALACIWCAVPQTPVCSCCFRRTGCPVQ